MIDSLLYWYVLTYSIFVHIIDQNARFEPKHKTGSVRLYNLEADPQESVNVFWENPDIVSELLQKLKQKEAASGFPNYPPPSRQCRPIRYQGEYIIAPYM
mgnify:CR=1 FL=1